MPTPSSSRLPRGFTAVRAPLAVERAVRAARAGGLDVDHGEVVSDGANILVRLEPQPALARVAHWIDLLRADGAYPWQEREVAITRYLAGAGFPGPRPLAGPVSDDGISISFWEWLEHDPHPPLTEEALGRSLARLHEALAGYGGDLPRLSDVVAELAAGFGYIRELPEFAEAVPVFERNLERVLGELDRLDPSAERPLHGDAHADNVVGVDGELMWIDFEDTCLGPVEYDLATLLVHGLRRDHDEATVLDAYGPAFDRGVLDVMVRARSLQIATWAAVLQTELDGVQRHERIERWLAEYAD